MKRAVNIAAALFNLVIVCAFVAIGIITPSTQPAVADTTGVTEDIFVPLSDNQIRQIISDFSVYDDSLPFSDDDVQCLTENLYFEARSEGTAGMMAVGQVVLNRMDSNRFPSTVCRVVRQGRQDANGNMIRHQCQFSWYCDGRSDVMRNETARQEAERIARLLLIDYYRETKYLVDITEGSLFYHTTGVRPAWRHDRGMSRVTTIGTHIFYTWNL